MISAIGVPDKPVVRLHSGSASDHRRRVLHPLSWSVTNAICTIVSPEVGPSRETSVVVQPTVTTTHKLYATNQYGRSVRSGTVTAH